MSDPIGTEEVTSPEGTPSGPEVTQQEPAPEGGGNPAWETVRSKLDPISFSKIEEDLKGWDKSAETRISSVKQQLSAYSELGTPEQLKSYATLAQRIDTEPEVIHQALGDFLRKNGRLPETNKELTDAVDQVEDENAPEENPELAAIKAGQEEIKNFLAQQEEARAVAAAEEELATEITTLQEAHPELDERDVQNVLQRAAFIAQTTNKIPTLEEVAVEYIEKDRNRILSTQRPGDSAPKLVPTGGGAPSTQQQQVSMGKMPREDVQNLIAGLVTKDRK